MNDSMVGRLPFSLEPFFRISWVSDEAQRVWEPQLHNLGAQLDTVELHSVIHGHYRYVLRKVLPSEFFALTRQCNELSLGCRVIEEPRNPSLSSLFSFGSERRILVVIGMHSEVDEAVEKWQMGSFLTFLLAAGWPRCCGESFASNLGCFGCHWTTCVDSKNQSNGGIARFSAEEWRSNLLLRRTGIRVVFHMPCSNTCQETVALANTALDLVAQQPAGMSDRVSEILRWPAEWTALHGIAVLKTPVFKASMNTIATATKLTVYYDGDRYPPEGATGVMFPYQLPVTLKLSESRAFAAGIANPIRLTDLVQERTVQGNREAASVGGPIGKSG